MELALKTRLDVYGPLDGGTINDGRFSCVGRELATSTLLGAWASLNGSNRGFTNFCSVEAGGGCGACTVAGAFGGTADVVGALEFGGDAFVLLPSIASKKQVLS